MLLYDMCMSGEPRTPDSEPLNDLRGVRHRAVHRDDAVVITGAEYMRLRRAMELVEDLAEGWVGNAQARAERLVGRSA